MDFGCGLNAQCVLKNGIRGCHCLPTYVGDGQICNATICQPPGDATFATISHIGPYPVGTTVKYTCYSGYQLLDGSTFVQLTCLSSGTWDGLPPICKQKTTCDDPGPGMNAVRDVNQFPVVNGTVITYTCKQGFTIYGGFTEKKITCLLGGRFDWSPPTCLEYTLGEYCDYCLDLDGPGHYVDRTDCSRFIQCYRSETGEAIAVVKYCPPNLFWSQEDLTCVRCEDTTCTGVNTGKPDCGDIGSCPEGFHANPSNCAGYIWCTQTAILYKCCPYGTAWNDTTSSCVHKPPECTDVCAAPISNITTTTTTVAPTTTGESGVICTYGPYKKEVIDSTSYYLLWYGGVKIYMSCGNQVFDVSICDCAKSSDLCEGEYAIACFPFDSHYHDSTGNIWWTKTTNMQLVSVAKHGMSAYFNGNSSFMEIPFFQNYQFPLTFTCSFWYMSVSGMDSDRKGLVNNGDCEHEPMFTVRLSNGETGTLSGGVYTVNEHNLTNAYANIPKCMCVCV
ncbi:sushi, von Willebrand factor type A, EGF and pentraxin domain-containing protein 1-like [Lingula anatina]|uniref:Sushi, von Willebrand factor type A, EGF and pentraxin domain-containing protein 1-like n=1 Tax=Lingula anatina TaxID=7574 RepID=A0A1S3HPG3_LINAN|nr:sushi, von Willebrand factor type A, EGF and pentraxin domain-containing protein 1-like [Lingula anatina]|eukprot:XP_013387925.1 sushi, von Willebrand factor type A, EGF and pentraxin domain-containing protein 1-like [Lingula anatina]